MGKNVFFWQWECMTMEEIIDFISKFAYFFEFEIFEFNWILKFRKIIVKNLFKFSALC